MLFALVARPRTGTNFFRSLLNSNRTVYCFNEILYPGEQSWGFYNWLKVKQLNDSKLLLPHHWWKELTPFMTSLQDLMIDAGKEHIGFDLKIAQLTAFIDSFRVISESGMHILHLRRIHTAAAVISILRAGITLSQGLKVHGPIQNPIPHLAVDDAVFQKILIDHEMGDNLARHHFSGGTYTEIYYEDLLHDEGLKFTEAKLSGLFGTHISLSDSSKLAKQGPWDLRENLSCSARVLEIIGEYDDKVKARRRDICGHG